MGLVCTRGSHGPGYRNAHIPRVTSAEKKCHMSHCRCIGNSNVDERSGTKLLICRSGRKQLRDERGRWRVSVTLGESLLQVHVGRCTDSAQLFVQRTVWERLLGSRAWERLQSGLLLARHLLVLQQRERRRKVRGFPTGRALVPFT